MSRLDRGVFITGTDTDVGKTVVAAAVLCALRGRGFDAVPMKPVQTGGVQRDGRWTSPDQDFCLHMCELSAGEDEYQSMVPYIFEPACSPHLAVAESGRFISFDRITEAFGTLVERHDCVIAEGAGGVLVPIDTEQTMLDLMVRLNLPVVLVSRPALGTLNHTLLSLREMRRAGVEVAGVIFCESEPTTWGDIEKDNWHTIERLGEVPILGRIPFMASLDDPASFKRTATEHLLLEDALR